MQLQWPLSKDGPPWTKPPNSHTALWSSPIFVCGGPWESLYQQPERSWQFPLLWFGKSAILKSSYPAGILHSEVPGERADLRLYRLRPWPSCPSIPSSPSLPTVPGKVPDLRTRHLGPCGQISPLLTVAPGDIQWNPKADPGQPTQSCEKIKTGASSRP